MAETTYTTQCYLKGSVSTSIDNSGVITKTLTWIVLNTGMANSLLDWLAFQDYVENTWAGKVGDNWKKPIQPANTKEVTQFATDDSSFIVTDISVETPSGRTHCEVTYTCTGNAQQITQFADGGYSVNSSNEKTKSFSFTYVIPHTNVELGSSTWLAPDLASVEDVIKGLFDINDSVSWVDSPSGDTTKTSTYVVEDVSVSQESINSYKVNVSLKDMSKMRIGLVSVNEDSFGQKTLSVNWRMSKDVYDATVLPSSGDTLKSTKGDWLGDGYDNTNYGDYVITGVEHSPDGILGYIVTINAKDTTKTMLRTNSEYKWNGSGIEKSATVTYQLKDVEDIDDYVDSLGKEQVDLGYDSFTLRDASVSQNGKNDYELTLSLSDDTTPLIVNVGSNAPDDLAKDIQVSMNYGTFYLTPFQCGLFRSVSNLAYYPINNPPQTKWQQKILISDLKELDARWTDAYIIQTLKATNPHIGFSKIIGARGPIQNNIKNWHTNPRLTPATSDSNDYVYSLVLNQYVYAQPMMTKKDAYIDKPGYNQFFTPWVAKDSLLVIPGDSKVDGQYLKLDLSNYPKNSTTKLDKAMPEQWLTRKIPFMDCTVTMNYRGNLQTVLNQDWGQLFIKAVHQICSKAKLMPEEPSNVLSPNRTYTDYNQYFLMPYEKAAKEKSKYPLTSFKRTSMSVTKIIDTTGKEWTQVTMGIQALLGDFWNPNYKEQVDFTND